MLYFCNSTINPILYNSMSKKFRLAFKRTLCRCCYSSDELLELNGKSSKSVYCSIHSVRQNAMNSSPVTKTSYTDLNGTKILNGLHKPEGKRELLSVNGGNKSPRCTCGSQVRLNEAYSDSDSCKNHSCINVNGNGFGPRAVGLKYQSSATSSMVSFCDMESDSVVEMKSMSSGSSSNLLNNKLLTVPMRGYQIKRGSFV